jgi:hypothetical protein
MRQASKRIPDSAEKTVRDIRRATLYVVRTFRTFGWQFKRVSGSSGLKIQAAIAC